MSARTPDDFTAEVQAHLDLETDRLVAEGMTRGDARAAALRAFGSPTRAREQFYERSRWMWLEQFTQDLRYAWRGLRASPSFLATTVLTLAVGLALVTVVFSVFNAYVLRPFAVTDPSSLYGVGWRAADDGGQQFQWEDYDELARRADVFQAVIADDSRLVTASDRTLSAAFVSDNYFDVLAPRVRIGRTFGAGDRAAAVAVLSDQAWARLFDRQPSALGRSVDVNGSRVTVVGVLHSGFTSLDDTPRDLWVPASAGFRRPLRHVEIVARLRPDVALPRAEAAIAPLLAGRIETTVDRRQVRGRLESRATPNPLSIQLLAVLSPVFAAFALVLATACANVSNVMLSRALARRREIAVRLSLGATRARVVRQLVTEGLLIALLSGSAALLLASWTLRGGLSMFFRTLPPSLVPLVRVAPLSFDVRVFIFALAAGAATTLLFALVPALQASRLQLTDALKGDRGGTPAGSRLRQALVVAQVAASLVLVVMAITLGRNAAGLASLDPGFEPRGVMSVNVRTRAEEGRLIAALTAALSSDPRVAALAVTNGNPFFVRLQRLAAVPDRPQATAVPERYSFVTPDYFSLLHIRVVRGREFRADEAAAGAPVAIVSAATARAFWPGQDPINRRIAIERPQGRPVDEVPDYTEVTVVGVAGDVISGLIVDGEDPGHIYLPASPTSAHARALLYRARPGADFGPDARAEVFRRLAGDPQVFEVFPLDEVRDTQIYPVRAASWIGVALGVIALVLSVSGLYGVLSYTLAQRTREIGIRMALGATAAAVIGLMMRQSVRLAGVGMVIGLLIAFAALAALSSVVHLSEISFLDVAAFGGGVAVVAAATAAAAYRPARRASRIDPAVTLRAEG